MKRKFFFDKFILRTPALPFSNITFNSIDELKCVLDNSLVLEAIYLASPNLYSECIKWLNNEPMTEAEIEKLVNSILRYYSRMTTRSTPFGLFAGCTTGEFGNENKIILSKKFNKELRLDMMYLTALSDYISNLNFLKEDVLFFPNSSIYAVSDKLRYVEYVNTGKRRVHKIVSISRTKIIEALLIKAENGAKIQNLANVLIDFDVSIDEALDFINEIITSQLLVSEFQPSVTGNDFLQQIISTIEGVQKRKISECENTNYLRLQLIELKNKLEEINSNHQFDKIKYDEIIEHVKLFNIQFDEKYLFQVDLIKHSISSHINKNVQNIISDAINVLLKLQPPSFSGNLANFKTEFIKKYEGREVPLLKALDYESGIGYLQYGSKDYAPLIDDILFFKENASINLNWNKIEDFLLKKYISAIKNNEFQVEIFDWELKGFNQTDLNLNDTSSVMTSFCHDHNLNEFIQIISIGGSSALNLLARFCYADKEIAKLCDEIVEFETKKNEKIIYAEIIHLPEARVGNILLRPTFREYEINYLAKASVNNDYKINLKDLFISVVNNTVYLRSKKLNKWIIPKLSSAHNYSYNSLPIYHFLCELQHQHQLPSLYFNWGNLRSKYDFLPRVVYKNIIFSLAQWNFDKSDYQVLINNVKDKNILEIVKKWSQKNNLPPLILLCEGDNELFVNLNNILSTRMFINLIKTRNEIVLKEFLFSKENAIVKDEAGSYINQIIFSLKSNANNQYLKNFNEINQKHIIQRTFLPGSEWCYIKVYCGNQIADTLLINEFKLFIKEMIIQGKIEKWFFIRFGDPENHLRLRFYSLKKNHQTSLLTFIEEYFTNYCKEEIIWKIQIESYERELERYGYELIEFVETYFFLDSSCVVDFISSIGGDKGEEIRWLWAMKSLIYMLSDFTKSDMVSLKILSDLVDSFGVEFGLNKFSKNQLNLKYRKLRREIENFQENDNNYYTELLKIRSEKSKEIVGKIMNTEFELNESIIKSIIHMNMNRIFRSNQRKNEFVVYYFLHKYLESKISRKKYEKRIEGLN
jgi:thiopeptide-type bacteriocin biosynthesis protein